MSGLRYCSPDAIRQRFPVAWFHILFHRVICFYLGLYHTCLQFSGLMVVGTGLKADGGGYLVDGVLHGCVGTLYARLVVPGSFRIAETPYAELCLEEGDGRHGQIGFVGAVRCCGNGGEGKEKAENGQQLAEKHPVHLWRVLFRWLSVSAGGMIDTIQHT